MAYMPKHRDPKRGGGGGGRMSTHLQLALAKDEHQISLHAKYAIPQACACQILVQAAQLLAEGSRICSQAGQALLVRLPSLLQAVQAPQDASEDAIQRGLYDLVPIVTGS